MIDVKTAYSKVKELPDKNFLIEATDFGDFFGFVFVEKKPSDDDPVGCGYDCIDKKTGRHFTFYPFDDFDLFDKGISIPIEEVT